MHCQGLFEGCAMMRDHMRVGTLVLLLACVVPGTCQAKGIGWPEAVGRLTRERSKAATCVTLLTSYGKKEQTASLRMAYSDAKANFDGVIVGLVIALNKGSNPESLSTLDADLVRGESGLTAFCNSVKDVVPSKGFIVEEVKELVGPGIKALSEGVAALYNDHRKDEAATRQKIQAQLEAAKWPELGEVACGSAPSSRAVAAMPLVRSLAAMANELETTAPSKERIHREMALKEARISLMHDGWKPEWGNYDDFLRWVTEQAARDPAPPSIATAAAIYRGQAK